jgi:predicted  nucleic acid-binding Zn-ribbon protein
MSSQHTPNKTHQLEQLQAEIGNANRERGELQAQIDDLQEQLEESKRLLREWTTTGGRIIALAAHIQCVTATAEETEKAVRAALKQVATVGQEK